MTVSMRVMSAGDGYKVPAQDGRGSRRQQAALDAAHSLLHGGGHPARSLGRRGRSGPRQGRDSGGRPVSEHQLQLLMGLAMIRSPTSRSVVPSRPTGARRSGSRRDRRPRTDDDAWRQGRGRRADRCRGDCPEQHDARWLASTSPSRSRSPRQCCGRSQTPGSKALIAEAHHRAVAEVVCVHGTRGCSHPHGRNRRRWRGLRRSMSPGSSRPHSITSTPAPATPPPTHVVISNKAKTVLDGKWRSLDGRPMHAAVVALSELHEAVFADHDAHLRRLLGSARDGPRPEPSMGDHRRAGGTGRGVLHPRPPHRCREEPAHRRVRCPSRTPTIERDDPQTPSPGQLATRGLKAGPILG